LPDPRQARLRRLKAADGGILDDAVVLRFDGSASSTGEDIVEFQCHGGRAIIDAVLAELASIDGLRLAEPGEFTRRAFENGRIDLTEAEGLADLLEAETESQRKAALAIAEGGLRRQVEAWQERVLHLSARAEAAIDYVDEEDVVVDPGLAADCADLADELKTWLDRPRIEPLRDGIRVVVAGPPNAGKSSLVNAIAGQDRAIVTNVPGTTRDHLEVPLSLAGVPIVLTDTAGLRDTKDTVERIGVERARTLTKGADILIWMGEPDEAPEVERLIRVHARCDLPGRINAPEGNIRVSSITGDGILELLNRIRELAGSILPSEGAIALNRRQATHIQHVQEALAEISSRDVVLTAENLRIARRSLDQLTGRAGVEDLLDALFDLFCLGK
jgi:tRNA modification GTPase